MNKKLDFIKSCKLKCFWLRKNNLTSWFLQGFHLEVHVLEVVVVLVVREVLRLFFLSQKHFDLQDLMQSHFWFNYFMNY